MLLFVAHEPLGPDNLTLFVAHHALRARIWAVDGAHARRSRIVRVFRHPGSDQLRDDNVGAKPLFGFEPSEARCGNGGHQHIVTHDERRLRFGWRCRQPNRWCNGWKRVDHVVCAARGVNNERVRRMICEALHV